MNEQPSFYNTPPVTTMTNISPITYESLWEFNFTATKIKRRTVVYAVGAALWIIILLLVIGTGLVSEKGFNYIAIFIAAFVILFSIYMILAMHVLLPKQIRKHPHIGGTCTYVFDEEGFTDNTVTADTQIQSRISYSAILAVRESEHYIYLYNQPNTAYIVLKSGFTVGSETAFKALLRAKIQPSKLQLQ